ncbi:beta-ketoacyl-ACP synthase II [Anaerosphaera multitolerans]|uniref:3-oxoacyl-[acyl-carrier-protein] synthase 2 n=1 Tax=Anaerosphaera multitolerans TaxID=2487351 RepID=A0A437S782_9FIRM|nr:beta-ketoacyl-ACP synthase II [Anaerosphaera multitolerans]RVU54831.1 beta-ketoacyl-[acyl-carrier-protein] synthase II [Anaerosphaera multitolerans]
MRRVVVTGMGFISPIGNDIKTLWKNVKEGNSAVDFIEGFDTSDLRVKVACQCRDFNPSDYFNKKDQRRTDRVNQFGIAAARNAKEDSKIDLNDFEPTRVGIMVASGIGGLDTIETETIKASQKGFDKISPFFIPMVIANMTAAQIAIELGVHGYVGCPVTACASANNAILDGYRSIVDGYNDVVFAGGAEASINHLGIGGFSSMRALNESNDIKRSSIPFDKERAGFVMGEGAGVLVLEELNSALKRGAKIYGEIVGGAITCDANHITAPEENGIWASMAMEQAVKNSGMTLEDVDYINAHGTSTPLNDKIETKAVKNTFKDHAYNLKLSSTKSMTGHLLGASGAIEAIITLLAIENSFIPPTVNYLVEDEECDLNIVPNKGIEQDIKLALSNSLGFGGHNITIAMKGY